jgi:hypothetical protein
MNDLKAKTPAWKWVYNSPMRDGSGTVDVNGKTFSIFVENLISTKHRVAVHDGVEVARASSFPRLMRKLLKTYPAAPLASDLEGL